MNYRKILLVLPVCAMIASCGDNGGSSNYETSESGIQYKFYSQNEQGVKPNTGDYVQIVMSYRSESDSVLFDSKTVSRDGTGAVEFPLGPSTFKGSFEDAVAMMHVGDSASFKISADSVYFKTFRVKELPPYVKAGSMLTFEAKLINVKSKAIIDQQRQKQMEMAEGRKGMEAGEIAKYIEYNKITVKPTESGLYFINVEKGKGEKVESGKTVQVKYTGKFLDGRIFDTSEGKSTPIEFPVGVGGVIKGWDEALVMMNVGGKAKLVIPSAIAYGPEGFGNGVIPPYTPLAFDVEIVAVK